VCNEVREGVRKVTLKTQTEIAFENDLFSGQSSFIQPKYRDRGVFSVTNQKLSDASGKK
jgi:hypothetical protein